MKKCPKCKAEIEEEARFCLYCMTSFEEKQIIETSKENNKRWPYIIAAVLLFFLILLIIYFLVSKNSSNKDISPTQNSSVSSVLNSFSEEGDTASTEQQNSEHKNETDFADSSQNETHLSSENEGSVTNNPPESTYSSTINSSQNSSSKNSSTTNSDTTSSDDTTTNDNSQNDNTSNETNNNSSSGGDASNNDGSNNSSTSSTAPTPPEVSSVTYIYRDARYGDDFSVGANLENSVVITGVKTASLDGKYIIPETLGGKKVIAIMALAFCDDSICDTVKTVVVPSTVKTIWNNAFANCYNLTDIYFKGNSIYTETAAFAPIQKRNGTLTIHCSANCSDRNYRYYKNSASYYDADYAEWNG